MNTPSCVQWIAERRHVGEATRDWMGRTMKFSGPKGVGGPSIPSKATLVARENFYTILEIEFLATSLSPVLIFQSLHLAPDASKWL